MKDSENKIIASKLSELNELPEGYQPNLDSKWELLEASLNVKDKDKRRGIIWMRAAAALIVFGLLGFWLQTQYKVTSIVQNKTNGIAESASKKIQASEQIQNEKKVADKFVVVKPRPKKFNAITNRGEDEKNIAVTVGPPLTVVSQDTMLSTIETRPQLLSSADTQVKKTKSRYVQLDFDNTIEQARTHVPEPTLLVKNIKFSLLKSHDTRSTISVTPHEALFKINF